MEKRLSKILEESLLLKEAEILHFIETNKFYLAFTNKDWTSCSQGKNLMDLTTFVINLRYTIDRLKKNGL